MIFLKKNTWNHDIFFKFPKKDGLSKKNCTGIWSFLYYLKRWYFFPKNMIYFLSTENERWSFSRNTWKYDIFCVYVKCRILERVPMILWNFMETFIGVFIYCFPVKKNQETQYTGFKFDFFFNLFGWRYEKWRIFLVGKLKKYRLSDIRAKF